MTFYWTRRLRRHDQEQHGILVTQMLQNEPHDKYGANGE